MEKDMLKKIYTGVIVLIIICLINLLVTLIYVQDKKGTNDTTEDIVQNYDVSKFTQISASEIKSKTTDKISVIYIGRSTCSWCVKFVSVLKEATVENNLNTLYIDIAKIIDFKNGGISDQAAYETLIKLETVSSLEGYMDENFGATPMTLIVKDGKILAAQTGYVELDNLNSFLKENNVIS